MAAQVRQSESAKQNVLVSTLTNKQNRSAFILLLSVLLILGINSVLPMIEVAHTTAEAIEVTYKIPRRRLVVTIELHGRQSGELFSTKPLYSLTKLTKKRKLEITVL